MPLRLALLPSLGFAALLSACSGANPEQPDGNKEAAKPEGNTPEGQSTAEPPTKAGATLTLNGAPFELESVLAFSRGGSGFWIRLLNKRRTCDNYRDGFMTAIEGQQQLILNVDPRLNASGEIDWHITEATFDAGEKSYSRPVNQPVTVLASDLGAKTVTLGSDHTIEIEADPDFGPQDPVTFELKGELNAQSCGVLPLGDPASRPQDDLTVTLAGRTVPMLGAVVDAGQDPPELVVSSQPIDCETSGTGYDLVLDFELDANRTALTKLNASGGYITSTNVWFDDDSNTGTVAGPPNFVETEGDHPLKLDVTTTLNGLPLTIKGTASAHRCE